MPGILNQPMQQAQRKRKPLQPGMPAMGGKQMPTAPTMGTAPSGAPPMPGPMPSPMGAGGGPASAQAGSPTMPQSGTMPVSPGAPVRGPAGMQGPGVQGSSPSTDPLGLDTARNPIVADEALAPGARPPSLGAGAVGDYDPKQGLPPTPQSPEDMWGSILEDYNATLPEQLRLAEMEGARQSRRMTELAPGAGGVGGAWGGAAAQGALGTAELKMGAQSEHQMRGLEMKMAWLEMMIERARDAENQDMMRELQGMKDETALAISQASGQAQVDAAQAGVDASEAASAGWTDRISSKGLIGNPLNWRI